MHLITLLGAVVSVHPEPALCGKEVKLRIRRRTAALNFQSDNVAQAREPSKRSINAAPANTGIRTRDKSWRWAPDTDRLVGGSLIRRSLWENRKEFCRHMEVME